MSGIHIKIILFIITMNLTVAFADTVSQQSISQENENEAQRAVQSVSKFNSMMIDCKLDYFCLLKNIETMAKESTDKSEKMFFEFVYQSIYERKSVIEAYAEQCKTESVQAVRDSKLICLQALNGEIAKSTSSDEAKVVNDNCMLNQLVPKAETGNLFAMILLAEHYHKNNNQADRDRWVNELMKHKESGEFQLLDKCFY